MANNFPGHWWLTLLASTTAVSDLWILWYATQISTDDALTSVWNDVNFFVFIVYGLSTLSLFWFAYESNNRSSLLLSSFHFFTSFSLATIVFKIGFGFDPFIHRAAERVLFETGTIEPRQLLYMGQYTLVAALTHITQIPLVLIDKWLVPILASVTIPTIAYRGLTQGFNVPQRDARTWIHALLLVPFMPLVFTVPHNLTIVVFIVLLFLLPVAAHDRRICWSVVILALWAVTIHPLLGVPTLLLTIYVLTLQKPQSVRSQILVSLTALVTITIAVPALFAFQQWQIDPSQTLSLHNPFNRLDLFFGLFRDPFVHNFFPIPLFWKFLYLYRTWIPGLLLFAAFLFAWIHRPFNRLTIPYTTFALGLLGSIFILSTSFTFTNVISYEQSEYALRLLQALTLVGLPFLIIAISTLTTHKKWIAAPLMLVMSLFLTISWYMSYPQSNQKVIHSGVSVSQADIDAVRLMEKQSAGEPYFVLSNQMTAAAALQEFGFKHYLNSAEGSILWYPIPTGGGLYQHYLAASYLEPGLAVMQRAARFTGVDRGYLLVYRYDWNAPRIISALQQSTNSWFTVHGGDVMIFSFNKL